MSREPIITPRPQSLPSEDICIRTGCGNMYVELSLDPKCDEIVPKLGKSGSCQRAFLEALWRILTASRRQLNPIPRVLIVKALEGIQCPMSNDFVPSCPEAIARVLKERWGLFNERKENEGG